MNNTIRSNTSNARRLSNLALAVLAGGAMVLGGCQNAGEGALSGAAVGALGGMAIGSLSGDMGKGAAAGAVGGAIVGGIIGDQNGRNNGPRSDRYYNDY